MNWNKVNITGEDGAPRRMLVEDGQLPEAGIPLLDLGALELPEELETELRKQLWAHGIREYTDALKPGKSEVIASAIRSTLKLSVSSLLTVCQGEHQLLMEAGYDSE